MKVHGPYAAGPASKWHQAEAANITKLSLSEEAGEHQDVGCQKSSTAIYL